MKLPDHIAILQSFDGHMAVLEFQENGTVTGEKRVPRTELPTSGRHIGAVFGVSEDREDSVDLVHLRKWRATEERLRED